MPEQQGVMSAYQLMAHTHAGVGQGGLVSHLILNNVGKVDVRRYATFALAIADIGATETTLFIPIVCNVIGNIAVPATLTLEFQEGGGLNISNGVTVTINGEVRAGLYQIFDWAGTGVVVFATELQKEIYPQWWGALADGVTNDTVAVQASFTALGAYTTIALTGNYLISQITITGQEGIQINCYNARFTGLDAGAFTHLIEITADSPCVNIKGQLLINTQYNLDYDCAIWVKGHHFKSWNVNFYNTALCWYFGDDGLGEESGIAENYIFGSHFHACLGNILVWGANTIVYFNGCVLNTGALSESGDPAWQALHVPWCTADWTCIRAFAGIVYITGSELVAVRADDNNPAINLQPLNTAGAGYYREYGKVHCSNTQIETPKLCVSSDPTVITSADIGKCLRLVACTGFVAENPGDLIWVALDARFLGQVEIKECDFYASVVRDVVAIFANNVATDIYVDDSSFGRNFLPGLTNITGGRVHFHFHNSDPTELTINAGAITITKNYHRIDGEGDAADNLDTINGFIEGMKLTLCAENDARAITVRDGIGNINLDVASNILLNNRFDKCELIYDARLGAWCELTRANNV